MLGRNRNEAIQLKIINGKFLGGSMLNVAVINTGLCGATPVIKSRGLETIDVF